MSSPLYEQFFLHYFVNMQENKFNYLQEKLKPYQHPSLDHSKKSIDLGYLKNYKAICNKYLHYVPHEKIEMKFTLNSIMDIISSVYLQYTMYFEKGGAYRIVFNRRSNNPQMRKLKSYIQQLVLVKLCEKFPENKNQFKSLGKYILAFFFTLNYIKTCNINIRGFCMLLKADNQQQSYNIQNIFGNYIIKKLSSSSLANDGQSNSQQTEQYIHQEEQISIRNFQKILKILSKDDDLTNVSVLTQQQSHSSMNINEFSTIKSAELKQQHQTMVEQQKLRCVVALQILINFLKDNNIKLTQIKIYKLLKLIGLIKGQFNTLEEEQSKRNKFSGMRNWQQVLTYCLQKNLTQFNNNINQNANNPSNDNFKFDRPSFQKILLIQICKKNYLISQKLFQNHSQNKNPTHSSNSSHSSQSNNCITKSHQQLQNYRQQTYQFILNYMNELFDQKIDYNHSTNTELVNNYRIISRLKQIYNYGEVILKPIVIRILKHQQMHEIYKRYFVDGVGC